MKFNINKHKKVKLSTKLKETKKFNIVHYTVNTANFTVCSSTLITKLVAKAPAVATNTFDFFSSKLF